MEAFKIFQELKVDASDGGFPREMFAAVYNP